MEQGSKSDLKTGYKTSSEDLRKEVAEAHEENIKLQAAVQEVTAINKQWQRYNNDRRQYVQKLLNTIQDLQEQLDSSKLSQPISAADSKFEQMYRELKDTCTALQLQIKSHKDDWETENREKKKVVVEKEAVVRELTLVRNELDDLKKSLEVEKRLKMTWTCANCGQSAAHVSEATFCTSVQVPYNPVEDRSGSPYSCPPIVDHPGQMGEEISASGDKSHTLFLGFPNQLATVQTFNCDSWGSKTTQQTDYKPNIPVQPFPESAESSSSNLWTGSSSEQESSFSSTMKSWKEGNISHSEETHCSQTNRVSPNYLSMKQDDIYKKSSSIASASKDKSSRLSEEMWPKDFDKNCGINPFIYENSTYFSNDKTNQYLDHELSNNFCKNKMENVKSNDRYSSNNETGIECPNCGRVFPPPRHVGFIDHIEFCKTTDTTNFPTS